MVARQSSGSMKTNHAWIADSHTMAMHGHGVELWGYFWSFPFRLDTNEVFVANYEDANLEEDSDENPLCLKVCVRLYGWSRIQNRRVVRKLQRRVKITPGIGFRVVQLLLQSSNLLSVDPGTFSDACLLGGSECLHNANNWPIRIKTTRSATSLVFAICAWLENFFSIPANSS